MRIAVLHVRASWRLPLAFFASGMAALLFEVLWFRALGRLLGNTVWAGALVLTAFMLGIALGGLLAARWWQRIQRPTRAFAAAEAIVGVSGSLLVWAVPLAEVAVGEWLAPLAEHGGLHFAGRLALALAAMLVPTTAMGATLAFGVRVLAVKDTTRALGSLYAANTFGACLAPLLAEYQLIDAIGLRGSALAAAGLNALAAAIALTVLAPAAGPAAAVPAPPRAPGRLLAAAAIAGAIALALEVIWFRVLLLYVHGTETSFAMMLTVVLVGIAIGGAISPLLERVSFGWMAALASLAVVLGYRMTGAQGAGIAHAVPLMLPAAILSGCLFTRLGVELRADAVNPQPAIGRLTAANTLGAAAGAALAALFLLPRLGMENSLFVLAGGYALLPLLLIDASALRRAAWPVLVGLASLALFPFGRAEVQLALAAYPYVGASGRVVRVTQGPVTTLQVVRAERYGEAIGWRLVTDSYSMSGIDRHAVRYMQLFAWLPLSLHAAPKRALLISYGAGNTAQALLSDPALTQLTVVDVSPEILGASRLLHGAEDPLLDRRVRVVLEDGRHYLRTRREQFDIITGEPPPPQMAGVVNLYTREYFQAMAARLAPGGLATYWVPIVQFTPSGARAVVSAFCDAFPDCTLWAGDEVNWILLGGRAFSDRPALRDFTRLWRDERATALLEAGAFEKPAQLGATFLADADQLRGWTAGTPSVVDDYPKRIQADIPLVGFMAETSPWLDDGAALRHFQRSPWIAAHWPVELIAAAQPYFAFQPVLNDQPVLGPQTLRALDNLLRDSDLRVAVLWLLDSDTVEQRIVARSIAANGMRPEYAYARGVGALAARDYPTAADALALAARQAPIKAGPLARYALSRAQRKASSSP